MGFHPLHTAPAIALFGALVGIGLLLHIALDCVLMRQGL